MFLKFFKFLVFIISLKILSGVFFKQLTPKNEYERIMWNTKDAIIDRRLRQAISIIEGTLLFYWSLPAVVETIKIGF